MKCEFAMRHACLPEAAYDHAGWGDEKERDKKKKREKKKVRENI